MLLRTGGKLPMQFEIYLVAKGKDDKVGKLNKMLIITLCWARSRRRIQPFVYTDEKRKVAIKLFLWSSDTSILHKTVLKYGLTNRLIAPSKGIQDSFNSGFWIPDTWFQSLSVELRFWIPIFSRIPDSLSCISDCKVQHSLLHKKKFFRIPDSTSKTFTDSGIRIPLQGARFTDITTGRPNSRYEERV